MSPVAVLFQIMDDLNGPLLCSTQVLYADVVAASLYTNVGRRFHFIGVLGQEEAQPEGYVFRYYYALAKERNALYSDDGRLIYYQSKLDRLRSIGNLRYTFSTAQNTSTLPSYSEVFLLMSNLPISHHVQALSGHKGISQDEHIALQHVIPTLFSKPSASTATAGKEAKIWECGHPNLTASMQEKMDRMGRDLDTLLDTIHCMKGVQDAQNNIIRRLSISHGRS